MGKYHDRMEKQYNSAKEKFEQDIKKEKCIKQEIIRENGGYHNGNIEMLTFKGTCEVRRSLGKSKKRYEKIKPHYEDACKQYKRVSTAKTHWETAQKKEKTEKDLENASKYYLKCLLKLRGHDDP